MANGSQSSKTLRRNQNWRDDQWCSPPRYNLCCMSRQAVDIFSTTSRQFLERAEALGIRTQRALSAYRTVFQGGGPLPEDVAPCVKLAWHPTVQVQIEHGTTKFMLRHDDGLETESVILPYVSRVGRQRNTLCVSSQVGCAMGCTFCETAQMGFMKNLTASQIVAQWFAATFDRALWRCRDAANENGERRLHPVAASPIRQFATSPHHIDNIVFMGMGEPMDNLDAVLQAIEVLTDREGAAIAPARISVSTVGRVDGIVRLAQFVKRPGFHKLRLAVSINAPNDAIRSQIMPVNRSTPMAKLMDAMLQWPTTGRQRVLIEYVLIPGVNDAPEHADELCEYLRPLKSTVNVIPYNPRRNSPWPAPSDDSVRNFVQRIHDRGQFVKRRQTLGRSVMAACGQLGNPAIRRRKFLVSAPLHPRAIST
jgi:23S rRNA (adenine2503-C2)-methyltransferase